MTEPAVSTAATELELTEALIARIARVIDEASPRDLSPLILQMMNLLRDRQRIIREPEDTAAEAERPALAIPGKRDNAEAPRAPR